MAVKAVGGGSSAVGASAHAACARFRGTDPLVTGYTRRALAKAVGHEDTAGGIPEARWMRAMTFERLVRNENFASEVATTTVGRLRLARPKEVVILDAHVNVDQTAALLAVAHDDAVRNGAATLLYGLAVPFVGFEDSSATDVKPDFAVIAAKTGSGGSWLIVGDAKDYERIRSRIDDARLLKGFLQVAVGAESIKAWTKLPAGMDVHQWGALAVPRNSFLQPEVLVEDLADHRNEIAMRIQERREEAAKWDVDGTPIADFVSHLKATFDPTACTTCTLFAYCRAELRSSADPTDLLVELGIDRDVRPHVLDLVTRTGPAGLAAPASVVATIEATITGQAQSTGQRRTDPAGQPGTINVVLAKSDAAALGVHGLALQRVTANGRGAWSPAVYADPQSPATRLAVMKVIGKQLADAMAEMRKANPDAPLPVHLVVPDQTTADVLVSIADNLAGVELSRLRWQRDRDEGRPALTYDGEPATVPAPLSEVARTAVSFLLESDRARALHVRSPIVDVRAVLAQHVVAGGPAVNSLRLDYLVGWTIDDRVDHRAWSDAIEASDHTPGARLSNDTSDSVHRALTGDRRRNGSPDLDRYAALVKDELAYKQDALEATLDALGRLPASALRSAYRAIEGDAQAVWRRRLRLRASDLVRFGRTYRHWRNSQVPGIESDGRCATHLLAVANPQAAHDLAASAGTRDVAFATVVGLNPILLDVESRRIAAGSRVVALHRNGEAQVELPHVVVDPSPKGATKVTGLGIGPLAAAVGEPRGSRRCRWLPDAAPTLSVGDRLVVADFTWFCDLKRNTQLNIAKPTPDDVSAPKPTCDEGSYDLAPEQHKWCCRSHESNEAEFSDTLAARRERGELNPETWPPIRDADAFEVTGSNKPVGNAFASPGEAAPAGLTIDDLD